MILRDFLATLRPPDGTRGRSIAEAMLAIAPEPQAGRIVAETREEIPGNRYDTATRYVDGGDPAGYSLSLTPWARTLGTEVDEASLRAFGPERYASLVLSEMTAYGDTEEGMAEVREELDRRLAHPGPGIPAEEVMARARMRLAGHHETAGEGGEDA